MAEGAKVVNHTPPPLGRVLETALYVADLARAGAFYRDVLGLRQLSADGRFHAYAAGACNVVLLFEHGATSKTVHMPGGTIPPHDGAGRLHLAFAISADDLAPWEASLSASGIAIEGRTEWPRGGRSIYFRDPDQHLIELATPGLWDIPGG